MTVKELSQLFYLRREIDTDTERLHELENDVDGLKAQQLTGMPKGGGEADAIAQRIARIEALKARIRRKQAKADRERERLEAYIETVDDSLVRQILVARFYSCRTWTGVAMQIGGGVTGNYCLITLRRWLARHK